MRAGHLETVPEQPEADGSPALELGVIGQPEQRVGGAVGQGVAQGDAPGVGVGGAGGGQEAAGGARVRAIGPHPVDISPDHRPGVDRRGGGQGHVARAPGQQPADSLGVGGRASQVITGPGEGLGEVGVGLVLGDHGGADLLEPVDQPAVNLGGPRASLHLLFQAVDPVADVPRRPAVPEVEQPADGRAGRLPRARVTAGVAQGLVAQQLGLPQRHGDPRSPGLALIDPPSGRAATADQEPDHGGGQGDGHPPPSTLADGPRLRLDRQPVGQAATLGLLLGPRLRLDPRQLGGAEPLLHAGPVRRDPRRHGHRVARPRRRLGGQAIGGQAREPGFRTARRQPPHRLVDLAPRGPALDLRPVLADERRLPGQDLAEDRAQREDVRALVQRVDLAARLLGRHVRRSPHHAPRPRRVAGHGASAGGDLRLVPIRSRAGPAALRPVTGQHLGQAPVHHLDLAEAPHHDVRRLQVAMDHPPGVRIGHRLADRLEDPHQVRQVAGRAVASGHQLGERPPIDQPHGDVGAAVGQAPQLVDRHDPGMLQLPADLRLLDEPSHHVGLVAERLSQDLDGQVAAQVGVVRPEHHAHAAAAQHAEEPESPGTRRQLVGRRLVPARPPSTTPVSCNRTRGTRPIDWASVAR